MNTMQYDQLFTDLTPEQSEVIEGGAVADFYIPGAAGKPVSTSRPGVLTVSDDDGVNDGQTSISISVNNHANGGEVFRLVSPDGKKVLSAARVWFNPGQNDNLTFTYANGKPAYFPTGMRFRLQGMRRANSGDAGIGGTISY